jgi:DeoR family suf operon transcriptional repressor
MTESMQKGDTTRWATEIVPTDIALLDLLRGGGSLTITDLSSAMGVTATAVRQRLSRLMGQGYVQRTVEKLGRGRPNHRYKLTQLGKRKSGANYADLAIALWQEIRSIKDLEVRRGLVQRLAKRLSEMYAERLEGKSVEEKMEAMASLFAERQIPMEYGRDENGRMVLQIMACPYPDLAEQDRGICAVEKGMFAELLGENLRLSQCRLDGETCCTYELTQLSLDDSTASKDRVAPRNADGEEISNQRT